MKNKLILFCAAALAFIVWSCKKDENRVYFEGGEAPQLTTNLTGTNPTVTLGFATQNDQAIRLSWTNPDYRFTTGVSSQSVVYELEIDTVGSNFTNPNKKVVAAASNLGITMTQAEFNDALLQMNLSPSRTYNLQMRVKASLNGAVPLYSNTLAVRAQPYAIPPKVTPPASGKLFMVGSATPGGWNNPVPVPSQEFTQVSPTLYELTLPIIGGESFLFLPVNGDWGAKFGFIGNNNENNVNGDNFKAGGGDMRAPLVGGNYKIEVNFQTGVYKLTKL